MEHEAEARTAAFRLGLRTHTLVGGVDGVPNAGRGRTIMLGPRDSNAAQSLYSSQIFSLSVYFS